MWGGRVACGPATGPFSVMKVRVTWAGESPGFCTSTQVSKPPAVQPSAKYQLVPSTSSQMGAVTAT